MNQQPAKGKRMFYWRSQTEQTFQYGTAAMFHTGAWDY